MGFWKSIGSFFGDLGKSAVSSITGAAINTGANAISANQQYKYQKELQESQQQYNTEMWDKQNAYNTPAQQLSRMREAGINPALSLSNGGLQNVAADTSTPAAPGFSMPNGSAGSDVGDNFIQQQKVNSELDVLGKQSSYYSAMANSLQAGTDRTLFDLGIDKELRPYILSGKKGKLSSDSKLGQLMDEQIETYRLKNGYTRDVMQDMKDQMAYTTAWMDVRNKMQTIEYNNLDAKLKSDIQNTLAQAYASIQAGNLSKAKVKEVFANCVYLAAAARQANANADFQEELKKNGGANPKQLIQWRSEADKDKAEYIIGKQFQADLGLAEVKYQNDIGLQDNAYWNNQKDIRGWVTTAFQAAGALVPLMKFIPK